MFGVESYASLRDSIVTIEQLPIPVFEFIHFLAVAYDCRLNGATIGTRPLIPLYLAYWLAAVGGGLWVGVLLGQPPGWLCSDMSIAAGLLAFVLLHAFPGDLLYKLLQRVPPLVWLLRAGDDVARALSVSLGGVERTRNAQHATLTRMSHTCAILCGTLAGGGGGLTASFLNLFSEHWAFRVPPALIAPPRPLVSAAAGAVWYHFATLARSPAAREGLVFPLFTLLPVTLLPFERLELADIKLIGYALQVLMVTARGIVLDPLVTFITNRWARKALPAVGVVDTVPTAAAGGSGEEDSDHKKAADNKTPSKKPNKKKD